MTIRFHLDENIRMLSPLDSAVTESTSPPLPMPASSQPMMQTISRLLDGSTASSSLMTSTSCGRQAKVLLMPVSPTVTNKSIRWDDSSKRCSY